MPEDILIQLLLSAFALGIIAGLLLLTSFRNGLRWLIEKIYQRRYIKIYRK